jgi:hypothetical protein
MRSLKSALLKRLFRRGHSHGPHERFESGGGRIDTYSTDKKLEEEYRKTHAWLFDDPPAISFNKALPPILIYQMGKVGSTSIRYTLENSRLPNPIYHVHQLDYGGIDWTTKHYIEHMERSLKDASLTEQTRTYAVLYAKYVLRRYESHRLLREKIDGCLGDMPWKIITLVRDPIMREVSNFFFDYYRRLDLADHSGCLLNLKTLSALKKQLIETLEPPECWVLTWFDMELKRVFGVDVYQFPFDHRRGYAIIHWKNIDVLVIKMEELTRCFSAAAFDFLGRKNMILIDKNRARQKEYYDTYRFVLDHVRLDAIFCKKVYSSKYVRHFYTPVEIKGMIGKWTGGH